MSVAWKRINNLFDPGSFRLMDELEPTIHLLGCGTIDGRKAYCCAGVPDARGVDILDCFHRKVHWLEAVSENPAPLVIMHDAPPQAPGGRTPIPAHSDELLASNDSGVGRVFCLHARLNGVAPQISAVFGNAGAAQTFPLRLADFMLIKHTAHMWIGRPDAVKLMLGAAPDADRLGGANMHCTISGVGDMVFDEDEEALTWISRCIKLLPTRAGEPPALATPLAPEIPCETLPDVIPSDLNKPFDMRIVLRALIDAGSWLETQSDYAKETLTGFARVAGIPIGVLANQSCERGGILFPESCRKMVRFIQFCDAYGIPMLFLADNPGLMVGVDSEQGGMIREASELLRALAVCNTPRACLVIRKAYTVGLYAMSGPGFDPAYFWATPNASISVFGPKALEYFASDRDLPPLALEAINEMLHHAIDPHDYEMKGYLSGVIEWSDLRIRLERFVREIETT
jgi:methylmalonyl-CoA decarboxylase subunit alpha